MTDDIVARLRDGKDWLNGGACCGDVDDAECCAAPACIFGEALKQFYEAADEIERLRAELAAANAKVVTLREALTFYAGHSIYRVSTVYMRGSRGMTAIEHDAGERARTALQETE